MYVSTPGPESNRTMTNVCVSGECYTGLMADKGHMYARDGEQTTCVNNCYGKCKSYDKFCVGEHYTNAVYRIGTDAVFT